jgi:hypothetical protein
MSDMSDKINLIRKEIDRLLAVVRAGRSLRSLSVTPLGAWKRTYCGVKDFSRLVRLQQKCDWLQRGLGKVPKNLYFPENIDVSMRLKEKGQNNSTRRSNINYQNSTQGIYSPAIAYCDSVGAVLGFDYLSWKLEPKTLREFVEQPVQGELVYKHAPMCHIHQQQQQQQLIQY